MKVVVLPHRDEIQFVASVLTSLTRNLLASVFPGSFTLFSTVLVNFPSVKLTLMPQVASATGVVSMFFSVLTVVDSVKDSATMKSAPTFISRVVRWPPVAVSIVCFSSAWAKNSYSVIQIIKVFLTIYRSRGRTAVFLTCSGLLFEKVGKSRTLPLKTSRALFRTKTDVLTATTTSDMMGVLWVGLTTSPPTVMFSSVAIVTVTSVVSGSGSFRVRVN